MKKSTIVTIILIAAAVVLGVIFISWYLRKATPLYIQGTVECTTYKASSKVPGRIEEMKVEEGQHVTKGELLYTLSTPELNAKLQQAEAVKSAASAMDQKARDNHPFFHFADRRLIDAHRFCKVRLADSRLFPELFDIVG